MIVMTRWVTDGSAGSGECIEVWDRQAYHGYREDVLTRIPDIAASLVE